MPGPYDPKKSQYAVDIGMPQIMPEPQPYIGGTDMSLEIPPGSPTERPPEYESPAMFPQYDEASMQELRGFDLPAGPAMPGPLMGEGQYTGPEPVPYIDPNAAYSAGMGDMLPRGGTYVNDPSLGGEGMIYGNPDKAMEHMASKNYQMEPPGSMYSAESGLVPPGGTYFNDPRLGEGRGTVSTGPRDERQNVQSAMLQDYGPKQAPMEAPNMKMGIIEMLKKRNAGRY